MLSHEKILKQTSTKKDFDKLLNIDIKEQTDDLEIHIIELLIHERSMSEIEIVIKKINNFKLSGIYILVEL